MRRQLELVALSAMSLLGAGAECCGVGEPELAARYNPYPYECYLGGCPIAVGAEAEIFVQTYNPADERRITKAKLVDPSLADLEVFHDDVLVRPHASGSTTIDATLAGGGHMQSYLAFAERASTRTLALDAETGDRPLAYAGSRFTVFADHRDAQSTPLFGHGLEQWSVSGGSLAAVANDDEARDPLRARRVIAGDAGRMVVKARPDATPLELDLVEAGAARSLTVTFNVQVSTDNAITLPTYLNAEATVRPMSADNRLLLGSPRHGGLVVSVDNPMVVVASVRGRRITLQPFYPGATLMTVTFDGLVRRFSVTVQ